MHKKNQYISNFIHTENWIDFCVYVSIQRCDFLFWKILILLKKKYFVSKFQD